MVGLLGEDEKERRRETVGSQMEDSAESGVEFINEILTFFSTCYPTVALKGDETGFVGTIYHLNKEETENSSGREN